MTALVSVLALGLVLPAPFLRVAAPPSRAAQLAMSTQPPADDEALRLAAQRVVKAATEFGSAQGEAAAAWVDQALSSGEAAKDVSQLMDQQLTLFEECAFDESDPSANKCKELDDALGALEAEMNEGKELLPNSKTERAAARVRAAAARFGDEHLRVAEVWTTEVRKSGAVNPAALLEQQVALFSECILDEDGEGSGRCQALEESLSALQAALGVGGRVVSTRNYSPSTK